jgi:hypothetical protein
VSADRPCWRFAAIVLVIGLCATGCVRRRLTVRSNPEGARVYVDNQEIGTTPVSTAFTYHAPRSIQLSKDGYETLTVHQNLPPPWFQYPVIDFFTENLWPWELRDEREIDFQLTPQQIVPRDALLGRASELRAGASRGPIVGPTSQPTTPPLYRLPPPTNMLPPD